MEFAAELSHAARAETKSEEQAFVAQELPDLSPVASSQGEDTILTCSICAPLVWAVLFPPQHLLLRCR